jgi:hypothetical protein
MMVSSSSSCARKRRPHPSSSASTAAHLPTFAAGHLLVAGPVAVTTVVVAAVDRRRLQSPAPEIFFLSPAWFTRLHVSPPASTTAAVCMPLPQVFVDRRLPCAGDVTCR